MFLAASVPGSAPPKLRSTSREAPVGGANSTIDLRKKRAWVSPRENSTTRLCEERLLTVEPPKHPHQADTHE